MGDFAPDHECESRPLSVEELGRGQAVATFFSRWRQRARPRSSFLIVNLRLIANGYSTRLFSRLWTHEPRPTANPDLSDSNLLRRSGFSFATRSSMTRVRRWTV